MQTGSLAVAILLHVPYVRRSGVWPYGEHDLYAVMADGIIPLLDRLTEIQGGAPRFTVAVSPVLADQLGDPLIRGGFHEYMERRIDQGQADVAALTDALAEAAVWGLERDRATLASWHLNHERDLMRSLRRLESDGAVECIGFPATGAILPILGRNSAVRGQILQGSRTFEQHLEHECLGMWLPGGAIGPSTGNRLAADEMMSAYDLQYAVSAQVKGEEYASPLDPQRLPSGLVVLSRHEGFAATCLDPVAGFPADPSYLGPPDTDGRRIRANGVASSLSSGGDDSLRVEITVQPEQQQGPGRPYRHADARSAALEHGVQAVATAKAILASHFALTGRGGVLVLPIEVQDFVGWIEGPEWLAAVVSAACASGLALASGAEAIHGQEPVDVIAVSPTSWSPGGDLRAWQADNTTWYWEMSANTLDHAESLADRFGSTSSPIYMRTLAQVTREAFLLVSGEWALMLGQGGEARDYAAERVRAHHDRFRRLAHMLDSEDLDASLLERYESLDNPFKALDCGLLSAHQPITMPEKGRSPGSWGGS